MPGKLALTLHKRGWLQIGDAILTIEDVRGSMVKVTVQAPKEIKILRDKVIEREKRDKKS